MIFQSFKVNVISLCAKKTECKKTFVKSDCCFVLQQCIRIFEKWNWRLRTEKGDKEDNKYDSAIQKHKESPVEHF